MEALSAYVSAFFMLIEINIDKKSLSLCGKISGFSAVCPEKNAATLPESMKKTYLKLKKGLAIAENSW